MQAVRLVWKMIVIVLSDKSYENDVYPLVKAFYPEKTIKVFGQQETIDIPAGLSGSIEEIQAIHIEFDPDKISVILLLQSGQTLSEEVLTDWNKSLSVNISADRDKKLKSQYKNAMKRLLYHMLSAVSGKKLPWGILTGIRPTKIAYELLEKGITKEAIRSNMREEYLCSEEKTEMSIRIAGRERKLLQEMDYQKGYSLYIGIPFCPSTCLYCSFPSYSIERFGSYTEDYLRALEKEIIYASGCFPGRKLTTVYFGGGTPTSLSAKQLGYLLGAVKKYFDFTNVREFSVEAGRPDSITKEKLEVLKGCGVDRISINPQSMQQRTLDLIGRKHTVEQIKEAFYLARETGHDNINMDMIIGLPGEAPGDVADTLRQIRELDPESLTVHTLALKRAARLNIEKDAYAGLKATGVPEMLEETIRFAKENAYLPYYLYRQKNMADNLENIGYARYGKEGLYNILIMEEQQTILALGAGAMSKFVFPGEHRIERVDNVKSITDYIGRIDEMIARKRAFIEANYGGSVN